MSNTVFSSSLRLLWCLSSGFCVGMLQNLPVMCRIGLGFTPYKMAHNAAIMAKLYKTKGNAKFVEQGWLGKIQYDLMASSFIPAKSQWTVTIIRTAHDTNNRFKLISVHTKYFQYTLSDLCHFLVQNHDTVEMILLKYNDDCQMAAPRH